jgi:8-oxo-dGTP pyrophosphatase MutT (NUDIX family)
MLREQVRRAIVGHAPSDHAERQSMEIVLTELERLADPFSEHADPVHLTGSAIVVGQSGVILLKHKRLGLWLQPGGHIEPGETPWAAAWRESAEETGLPLVPYHSEPELVHVDVHPGGRGHTHLDLRYVARVEVADGGDPDPQPPAGESQEVRWFTWPAAVERASDDRLKGLLARLAATVGG